MRGMKESVLCVWYERVSAVCMVCESQCCVCGMKGSVLCMGYERISAVCVV